MLTAKMNGVFQLTRMSRGKGDNFGEVEVDSVDDVRVMPHDLRQYGARAAAHVHEPFHRVEPFVARQEQRSRLSLRPLGHGILEHVQVLRVLGQVLEIVHSMCQLEGICRCQYGFAAKNKVKMSIS